MRKGKAHDGDAHEPDEDCSQRMAAFNAASAERVRRNGCAEPPRPIRGLNYLLSRDGRSMWLNDQKVEIFFRVAFPLAFGLAVLVLFSEVW